MLFEYSRLVLLANARDSVELYLGIYNDVSLVCLYTATLIMILALQ